MTRKLECPVCFFEFEVADVPELNDTIRCPDCGVDLEVVEVSPTSLRLEKCRIDEDWGE
ncbi:MAG: lysine biosynthesis protein LysW [Promethearchaeota archaeon]